MNQEKNNIILIKYNKIQKKIKEDIFNKNTLILEGDKDTIEFEDCTFKSDFKITNIKNEDKNKAVSIIFTNCTFKENFTIDLSDKENIELKRISLISNSQSKIKNINLYDFSTEKLFIKNYDIDELNIYNIDFQENARILFENLIIKNCLIKKVSQDAKFIQFHSVKILDRFESERVEFKNTYFNDFNLKSASIKLIKTSFLDSHLNSVEWGELSRIEAKKDIFRQLKFVSDSIGNHIDGNNFFAQEMRIHQKELLKNKRRYWLDIVTLFLNKEISNFGRNWLLAFIWVQIITFLTIIIYTHNNSNYINDESKLISFVIFLGLIMISIFVIALFRRGKDIFHLQTIQYITVFVLLIVYYFLLEHKDTLKIFFELISLKPQKGEDIDITHEYWTIHKLLISFPLYHLTISLRRLTRR